MFRVILRLIDRLEEVLIASLMAAATLLIFVAVLHRYASGISFLYPYARQIHLSWAQELCIYMLVWMAKFGAAYGVRTGIHVGVDVAITHLDRRSYQRVVLFGLLCGALFTFVIGSFGAHFVWNMAQTEQTSPDLELPSWIVYLAIPAGSYLMCFRFLQVAHAFARTGELPRHDATQVEGVARETERPVPAMPPAAL
jgi:C4-dicarboxylate transporter DctQ subunit